MFFLRKKWFKYCCVTVLQVNNVLNAKIATKPNEMRTKKYNYEKQIKIHFQHYIHNAPIYFQSMRRTTSKISDDYISHTNILTTQQLQNTNNTNKDKKQKQNEDTSQEIKISKHKNKINTQKNKWKRETILSQLTHYFYFMLSLIVVWLCIFKYLGS